MKKIVLLVALCLCVGNLFAQDADKLRDEGDAALKAKDYATVVTKYGEYLKQNNYQDTARIFNCGYAANQAKNYAEAAKYFDMAVKMNYNVDDSYVGEAMAYRNLNKTEEFLTTVKEGLKVIPDGNKNKTNLEKLHLRLLHQTRTSRPKEGRSGRCRENVQRGPSRIEQGLPEQRLLQPWRHAVWQRSEDITGRYPDRYFRAG